MTQQTDLTAIMNRIALLKNLADRPGTPEEAANALDKIKRLMDRYNLTSAQVDGAERDKRPGFDNVYYDIGFNVNWRKTLLDAIAKYSYCSAIFDHSGKGVHIVGQPHNVEIVKELFEYLATAIVRLADEGWNELGEMQAVSTARTWKHNFRVGASRTLRLRLDEQRRESMKEQQAENPNAGALVVVMENELNDAVAKYFPRIVSSSKRASIGDAGAYAAGRAAGQRVSLADQING